MNEQQLSLFPARDSLKHVEQEAIAQLPITEPRQIHALLQIQQNTIFNLIKQEANRGATN